MLLDQHRASHRNGPRLAFGSAKVFNLMDWSRRASRSRLGYTASERRRQFLERLQTDLAAIPGVDSVALSNSRPIEGGGIVNVIMVEGHQEPHRSACRYLQPHGERQLLPSAPESRLKSAVFSIAATPSPASPQSSLMRRSPANTCPAKTPSESTYGFLAKAKASRRGCEWWASSAMKSVPACIRKWPGRTSQSCIALWHRIL